MKYTEFLAATIESTDLVTEERLAEAFDRLDSDDSGFISVNVSASYHNGLHSTTLDLILNLNVLCLVSLLRTFANCLVKMCRNPTLSM